MTWEVEHVALGVADFHALDVLKDARRRVLIADFDHDAVVLGSHQPESDVNAALARRMGVEVVRRNSGGGAVWLPAGGAVWIDVVIPAADPLWTDDVRDSMLWLGRVWATVVAPHVAEPVHVLEGALVADYLGSKVCFVSEGPGEVVTDTGKVVGISQRRSRNGARFQCSLYVGTRLDGFAEILDLDAAEHARVHRAHVPVAGDPASIAEAFVIELNRVQA